jgi:hypothetical protein
MAFEKFYYLFLSEKKKAKKLCIIYCIVGKPTEAQGRRKMAQPVILLSSMEEWSGEGVIRMYVL